MKTITAWEVEVFDTIRIVDSEGNKYEMFVEYVKKYEKECVVSIWGSWVFNNVPASQYVILVQEGF